MTILQTAGLKKIYGGGETAVHALDGVDLKVEKGEFVAVVGTSGSGKSTLLHMLGGLDRPTSGSVEVDGQDIFSFEINTFDKATFTVKSTEHNRFVPVWKHTIILKPEDSGTTDYTDEVEIGAGFLTGMVALWSKCFYRHRQKKWQRLLGQD